MKKKIGIVILLFLVIAFGCFSDAFAADNSDGAEIGINNLNNTIENSAKVGDQLLYPEIGWKRYASTDSRIVYSGDNWHPSAEEDAYGGKDVETNSANGATIKFKFCGSKIRIIIGNNNETWVGAQISISLDGDIIDNTSLNNKMKSNLIMFEKQSLKSGIHTVQITGTSSGYIWFDGLDIGTSDNLIDYSSATATGVSLNKTTDNLTVGQTDTLTASVTPDNASNKSVTWKSSDDSIVSVDKNGKITALKAGTATVTAVTQDGSNLSASCTVNVAEKASPTNPTNPTGSGDKAALNITMTNGQVKQYNVTMDVVNKFISWYKLRSAGSGEPFSIFDITQASQSDIKRTDYVVFDKISSFEVDDYTK